MNLMKIRRNNSLFILCSNFFRASAERNSYEKTEAAGPKSRYRKPTHTGAEKNRRRERKINALLVLDNGPADKIAERRSFPSFLLARAKRGRVVQDEVEKANRRPTRHDTTRHPKRLSVKLTRSASKPFFKIYYFRRRSTTLALIYYLKIF